MNYVVADIHNENKKLQQLLKEISFCYNDHLYLLGDLFDRGGNAADPVGVYFTVLWLGSRCTVVRGNHDQWLADYIDDYLSLPKEKRREPYQYNSFDLIKKRLPPVDMQELASRIKSWPLQVELKTAELSYLLAHAQASLPGKREPDAYYLQGDEKTRGKFLEHGIEGHITFCGHIGTSNLEKCAGLYLDGGSTSIWCNDAKNLYMLDCGSGGFGGKLACLCIETGERWYA